MAPNAPVAIIGCGEMGSRIGAVLRQSGTPVVTHLEGRSSSSWQRAQQAGFLVCANMVEVVQRADVILTVVPPAASLDVARDIAQALGQIPQLPPRWVVDANAISPQTATRIGTCITEAGGRFIDAAIFGSAQRLPTSSYLVLSGPVVPDLNARLSPPLRVVHIGPDIGQASALKLFYAGLTKGLSALLWELLSGASAYAMTEPLLEAYRSSFPDVVHFIEQNLAGVPERAARRAQEMEALGQTLADRQLPHPMADATHQVLAALSRHQNALPPSLFASLQRRPPAD